MKTGTKNFDPVFALQNINDVMTAGSKIAEGIIESDCTIRCKEAVIDTLEDAAELATEVAGLLHKIASGDKPETTSLEQMGMAFSKKLAARYVEFSDETVDGNEEVLLLQDVFSWGLLLNAVRAITQDEDEAKFAAMVILGHAKRASPSTSKMH